MTVEFYRIRGCPYCRRVEKTLKTLDIDYETHTVPHRHSKRTRVQELTGQSGVPVITDREHGIEGMAESRDIVDYLQQTYG